jgi:SAM-dependent MidA family methyltransferase
LSFDEIAAAIDAAGGVVSFSRYMELALYGQHGFYTGPGGGRAGRRGDFLTSPEVGPLFGTVLCRALHSEWLQLGEPADFTVIECGAGPGTLARSVLQGAGPWLRRYVAVEISDAQRASHPDGVESLGMMPAEPITGVVLANELLDNLPFDLAVWDGGWREAFVGHHNGQLVEHLGDAVSEPWLAHRAAHGARAPLQRRAAQWVDAVVGGLLQRGRLMTFDYCSARTAELALQPWRDWLRTYRGHERGAHYLAEPGTQDITAQVCLDQLPSPDVVRTQAQFLQRWGIDELVGEGTAAWQSAAAAPTVAALRMRSRLRESEALLQPSGLGGFQSVEWAVSSR